MIGININCSEKDYCEMILNGQKKYETRNCDSLDPYLGKWVGLIKTGCGQAMLVGYAYIGKHKRIVDDVKTFRELYDLHRIEPGSQYDIGRYGNKRLYWIGEVKRCEPTPIYTKGIVARAI